MVKKNDTPKRHSATASQRSYNNFAMTPSRAGQKTITKASPLGFIESRKSSVYASRRNQQNVRGGLAPILSRKDSSNSSSYNSS